MTKVRGWIARRRGGTAVSASRKVIRKIQNHKGMLAGLQIPVVLPTQFARRKKMRAREDCYSNRNVNADRSLCLVRSIKATSISPFDYRLSLPPRDAPFIQPTTKMAMFGEGSLLALRFSQVGLLAITMPMQFGNFRCITYPSCALASHTG